jgi:hypothetical protein
MNDEEIKQRLAVLEQKIDATYVSAEKTRKYFLWVLVISLVAFVLPLVGLLFAVPSFLNNYLGSMTL